MPRVKLEAARELIREQRYTEAQALLRTMPDDATARKWLQQLKSRETPEVTPGQTSAPTSEAARLKSYTPHVVLVIILYLFLFIPGLIANVLFHEEGKRMEALAGEKLPGVGALGLLRRGMFIVLVIILLIALIGLGIPLLQLS